MAESNVVVIDSDSDDCSKEQKTEKGNKQNADLFFCLISNT